MGRYGYTLIAFLAAGPAFAQQPPPMSAQQSSEAQAANLASELTIVAAKAELLRQKLMQDMQTIAALQAENAKLRGSQPTGHKP